MPEAPPPVPLPKTIFGWLQAVRLPGLRVPWSCVYSSLKHSRTQPTQSAAGALNFSPSGETPAKRARGASPTSHVRGGSVSRRGLIPAYRRPRSPLRRNQLRRNAQPKRQPLFGRGGLGERRFSQRSGLSPRISSPQSLREGARGRGFSSEKPPPPESLLPQLKYFEHTGFQGAFLVPCAAFHLVLGAKTGLHRSAGLTACVGGGLTNGAIRRKGR